MSAEAWRAGMSARAGMSVPRQNQRRGLLRENERQGLLREDGDGA